METGSRSSIIQGGKTNDDHEEITVVPTNTNGGTRAEKMKLIRSKMREMAVARKDNMFKPVEGEVVVKEFTRKAMTKRGQRKLLLAKDVPNKLVQDRSSPMVIIGSDVESLYPSLDADQVAEIVHDAVMRATITFDGVHYQEECRYIVLNSSEQECRASPLRRVLPRRRYVNGTRPEVTGAGPMGAESGDQNQWKFRNVELSDLEKRQIVAMVIKIAVRMLFKRHVYSFGGNHFLQKVGGPIGLRSTCAVARLVMSWWDTKLLTLVEENNITLEEKTRYMDDFRLWLQSIRLGWRWMDRKLMVPVTTPLLTIMFSFWQNLLRVTPFTTQTLMRQTFP